MKQIKDQNHLSKELSALRKRILHSRWQKAVTVMAALVLFCTVYALILPAATSTAGDIGAGVEPDERVTAFETSELAPASSGSGGSESASGDTGTIEVSSQGSSTSGVTDAESNDSGSGGTEAGVSASDKGESTGSEGTAGSEGASVSEGGNSGQNAGEAGQPADSGSPAVSDGGSDGTGTGDGASTGGSTGSELTGSEGTAVSGGENSGSQTGGEGTVISGEGSGSGQTTGGEDAVISDGSSSEGTVVSEGEGTGAADPSAEEGTLESKENEASVASGGGTSAGTDSELLYDENGNPIVTEEAPLDENGDPIVPEELPLEELPAEPIEEEFFVGNLRASEPGSYKVSLAITEDAEIPMDAKLVVSEITDEEAYGAYRSKAADELGAEVSFARFFDISIMSGEEKVEPAEGAAVDVTITLNERVEVPEDGAKYAVHFPNDDDLDEVEIIEASGDPETEVTAPEEDEELIAEIASDEVVSAATEEVSGAEAIEDNEDILSLQAAPKLRSSVKLAAPKGYAVANAAGAVAAEDPEDSKAVSDTELMIGAAEVKAAALDDAGMFDELDYEDEAELYRFSFKQSTFSVVGTVVTESISQNVTVRLENGDDATYNITVEGTGIPKDGSLDITVIDESHEDYDRYYAKTLEAIGQPADAAVPARFFDITVLDENDEVIHPEGNFTVSIKLLDEMLVSEDADITAVHFKQDEEGNEEPVVLEKDKVKTSVSYIEEGINTVDSVRFRTDGFSVYAIVAGEINKIEYLSASGRTYEINLDLTRVSSLPEGTKLQVEELDVEDNDSYVSRAADAIGADADSLGYVKLLNISLVNNGEEIEPNGTVGVSIELQDSDGLEDPKVVHFGATTEVLDASFHGSTVSFETDGFSVYAVIDGEGGPEARAAVKFYQNPGDQNPIATVYIKNKDKLLGDGERQDDESYLEDIVTDPGAGDIGEGVLFHGWTTDPDYTASTTPMTIEGVRQYLADDVIGEEGNITEGDVVNLYAMLFKYYTVTYYGDDINGDPVWNVSYGSDTVLRRTNENSAPYKVNMAYSATSNQNFKGWVPTAAAIEEGSIATGVPAYDIPATADNISPSKDVYPNGTDVTLTGDVIFNVDAPHGYWLVYNTNGKGGTFNAPQFYLPTDETSPAENAKPENMKRNGYNFVDWYEASGYDDEGNPLEDENGNVILKDTPFVFGTTLSKNTNIYAKWNPVSTAPYTIVFWTQNADRTGYDVAGSYVGSGTVGQAIPVNFRDNTDEDYLINVGNNGHYTGFCLNHTGTDTLGDLRRPQRDDDGNYVPGDDGIPKMEVATIPNVTPEGDAVLNVYYDRIVYNLKFYLYRQATGNNGQRSYATRSNNGTNVWNIATGWTNVAQNSVPSVSSSRFTVERDQTAQRENINNNNSTSYYGYYFTLSAYYGENIEDKWPTYDEIKGPNNDGTKAVSFVMMNGTGLKGNSYTGNGYGDGRDTIKGVITVMDDGILGQTQDANGNYLIIRYASYNDWTYHIYYECIPGQTYESTVTKTINGVTKTYYFDHDVQSRSSNTYPAQQNPPAYVGFQVATTNGTDEYYDGYGGNAPSQGNITGYTVYLNYYYNRETYNITYMDGLYVDGRDNKIQSKPEELLENNDENIVQGATIPDQYKNWVPDLPAGEAGYVFEGWYVDEGCTTKYTWTTMPVGGITVHAKWRQVQYRVFLHPQADLENGERDLTLSWGDESAAPDDKQQMNFRVSWGDKISLPFGTRTGYEFIGWFKEDGTLYMAGTELNDTTIPAEPVYNKATDLTDTMDKFGRIVGNGETYWISNEQMTATGEPYNSDANRAWITRKLDLYGKWRKVIDGADGIKVTYVVGDKGKAGSEPTDPMLYKDETGAVAQAACTVGDDYKDDYQFLYWVVQKWNDRTHEYEDAKDEHGALIVAYPGDNFTVKLDYAKVDIHASHQNPNTGDTVIDIADYTMQLRAEYGLYEISKPTHIDWYLNKDEVGTLKAPDQRDSTEGLQINEAVNIMAAPTRGGYQFLGWARVPSTVSESVYDEDVTKTKAKVLGNGADPYLYLKYEDGVFKLNDSTSVNNGKTVTKVAADEALDYHDMYAVWKRLPVPLKVLKTDQTGNALEGATFTGDLITGGSITTEINASGEAVIIDVEDVETGKYTINETNTPNGYYPLSGPIVITIKEDGIEVKIGDTELGHGFIDGTAATGYVVTIQNSTGAALPSTGGHGTLLYTLCGLLLMLGSALMYGFRMRRREKRYY